MEKLYVMANPKYGSEKKGAPTNYYLTVAPAADQGELRAEPRGRGPLLRPQGVHPHQPAGGPEEGRLPGLGIERDARRRPGSASRRSTGSSFSDNNIRIFILPGLRHRPEGHLAGGAAAAHAGQLLPRRLLPRLALPRRPSASPRSSSTRSCASSTRRSSAASATAVVASNMTVMTEGFSRVQEINYGGRRRPDRSSMRNPPLAPLGDHAFIPTAGCGSAGCGGMPMPAAAAGRARRSRPWPSSIPSSATASATTSRPARSPRVGVMGAGSGATQSKYVARRETPVYIAENCTQCMECITACPDTALPNTAQEVATVLKTAVNNYVTDPAERREARRRAGRPGAARPREDERGGARREPSCRSRTSSARRSTRCRASPSRRKARAHRDHRPAAARLLQRAGDLPLARAEDPGRRAGCSPSSSPTSARAAANASRFAATTTPCA